MDSKAWYKSKAVWGGIITALAAIGHILITGEITPGDIEGIGVGLGIVGLRFKLN